MADSWLLRLCHLLSWATASAGVGAVLADLTLVVSAQLNLAERALGCYGVLLSVGIIMVERENTLVLRMAACLESWVCKGLYIAFVGVLLVVDVQADKPLQNFWRLGVGYYLIAAGALYLSLGLLCFRQLKSRQLRKIQQKKIMRQEMQSLSVQKQEIEQLLADTESKLQHL